MLTVFASLGVNQYHLQLGANISGLYRENTHEIRDGLVKIPPAS